MAYIDQFDEDTSDKSMSFLDHLEELRKYIIRSAIAVIVMGIVAFMNKEFLFDTLILGPKQPDFFTYKLFCKLAQHVAFLQGMCFTEINFTLANIDMTGQFMQHMSVAFYAGIITAFPFIVWQLWQFVKPALSRKEIHAARGMVFWISLLFMMGVLFGYFFIAPISILFLGSYQVSPEVINQINLSSYIATLSLLTLATGLIFELPILAYFLAKIGFLTSSFMRTYRRHAIVINLIIAAIITPSVDVASMFLMSIPMLLLYEVSITVVNRVERKKSNI